jgi:hypothetical protein
MLNASSVTREQFVNWIGNGLRPTPRPIDIFDLRALVQRSEMCLIWPGPLKRNVQENFGPTSRPVIVVADQNIREFFAFTNTYIGNYQPFSAFFRVLPLSYAIDILSEKPNRSNFGASKFVGAIIAETRSQLGDPRRELSEITIQSNLATMSFAAVGGIVSGATIKQYSELLSNWTRSRRALADDPLPIPSEKVRIFWEIVKSAVDFQIGGSSYGIHQELVSIASSILGGGGDPDPRSWHSLAEGLPRTRLALEKMKDSREERVRAMDDISNEIASSRIEAQTAEALLGYAASRVAGGSLRYFPILEKLERRFPLAPMWYGLFCSFSPDSDALVAGECLGRRIVRHLEGVSDIFAKPECDLSFEEFSVMLASSKPPRWRTELQNSISIEILPGVSSVFRTNSRSSRKESDNHEPTISVEILQEARYLSQRLAKLMENTDIPVQGRLFETAEKKPRYNRSPKKNDR